MLISLKEYCLKHGKDPATGRQRVARGAFKTAVKLGRDWFIEEDEPWVDNRNGTNSKRWKTEKKIYLDLKSENCNESMEVHSLEEMSKQIMEFCSKEDVEEGTVTITFKK